MEAVERIFGDPSATMPLVKQLAYEQCTRECRAAITPVKNKGLGTWIKACRELGGPLTNVGLQLQSSKLLRGEELIPIPGLLQVWKKRAHTV